MVKVQQIAFTAAMNKPNQSIDVWYIQYLIELISLKIINHYEP